MSRLQSLAFTLALGGSGLVGQDPCANCFRPACGGANVSNECPNQFRDAGLMLRFLGLLKGNATFILAGDCVLSMLDAGQIRFCDYTGSFMYTTHDCYVTNPDGTQVWLWCPGVVDNCICVNKAFFDDCQNSLGRGDVPAAAAILAAALAHEACHAKTGNFVSGDGGATFYPPCSYYLNEIACHCLEIDLLTCFKATTPPASQAALDERIDDLQQSKAEFQALKVANGC